MKKGYGKLTALIVATAMTVASLTGCGASGDQAATGAQSGTTTAAQESTNGNKDIVYGITGTWNNLVTYDASTAYAVVVHDKLFDPLAYSGSTGLVYRAAESVDVEDEGKTFRVHLRPDATWSDGEPVTSADWEWTFRTISDPAFPTLRMGYRLNVLEGTDDTGKRIDGEDFGIEVVDDYTFLMHLKNASVPDSFFVAYGNHLRAWPKHCLENMSFDEIPESDFWQHPVTNGICTVVDEPVVGQELVLQSRPDYYMGTPDFDKLTFVVVARTNASNALLNGDIDTYFAPVDLESSLSLDGQNGLHIEEIEGMRDDYTLKVNGEKWNANVRKALDMLIDKQLLVDTFTQGKGTIAGDSVLPTDPDYLPYTHEVDVDGAIALLQQEGFDFDNTVLSIGCAEDRQNIAMIIQQNWQAAGVKSEIVLGEATTMFADSKSGKLDAAVVIDTLNFCPAGYLMNIRPGGATAGIVTSGAYEEALSKVDFADAADRADALHEYQQLLRDECPVIYLYTQPNYMVERAGLYGIKGTIDNAWTWRTE